MSKKNQQSQSKQAVASPTSTGGAGISFEHHVGAYFLSLLLVKAIPPIFTSAQIAEVAFQTEYLGWSTDDLLVTATKESGTTHRIAAQVKRTLTVSTADEEFKTVITDSWKDWNRSEFSQENDRFAFIVLRGTNTLLQFLAGLFDLARNSIDAADFERRINLDGFIDKKVKTYRNNITTILEESCGATPDSTNLWRYLSSIYLISLDLNTATKQHEALIKSMLAFTAKTGAMDAADATWNELVIELSAGIPAARRYRYESLPESARMRHSHVASADKDGLTAALDHSKIIFSSIATHLRDGSHIDRSSHWNKLLGKLDESQIVLVTGVAGAGKSAIAKEALLSLSRDYFVFAFRAEEFAKPHLDKVLADAQINISNARLSAALAGQPKKVLLIDSVERLLESSIREAFTDLLSLVANDPTWQLVITCRKHSAELVRNSFLSRADHSLFDLPLLSDEELNTITQSNATAERLFKSKSLRQLLRNPYYLDKALQSHWEANTVLPETEQALRRKLWQDIVCADISRDEMPIRRARTFISIATERAKKLSMYVRLQDLDFQALAALRKDSLVSSASSTSELLAPAHDVLEDWALFSWFDEIFHERGAMLQYFANEIGTYPALRRAYRNWVSELIGSDQVNADILFLAVCSEAGLPDYFHDDILIAILHSLNSVEFLRRHKLALFSNEKNLFHRLTHLLRIACMNLPVGIPNGNDVTPILLPEGEAWQAVLGFIASELSAFENQDVRAIVALLKDWSRTVSVSTPYPPGCEYAASIIFFLLTTSGPLLQNDKSLIDELTTVLCSIPLSDPAQFSALLQDTSREAVRTNLRRKITEVFSCTACCRDMPDEVISTAQELFVSSKAKDLAPRRRTRSERNREFGFNDDRLLFAKPSALQGPFLQLLNFHRDKALVFILSFVNEAVDRFAKNRQDNEDLPTIKLRFESGEEQVQYCSEFLWLLYRGMISDAPIMLQSALMALEHWLLESAIQAPFELDELLLGLLRNSNNVAITAVVSSVATALTPWCVKTVRTLVNCREAIILDRLRMARESIGSFGLMGLAERSNPLSAIIEQERRTSNKREHRGRELAVAVMMCQMGPSADRIQAVLDTYLQNLPSEENQSDTDMTWRILLHCMDLRKHQQTPMESAAEEFKDSPSKAWVLVNPAPPAKDLSDYIENSSSRLRLITERLSVEKWAQMVLNDAKEQTNTEWKSYLHKCQSISPDSLQEDENIGRPGISMVAAVAIRDHWTEMTPEEQSWCVQTICGEAQRLSRTWGRAEIMMQQKDSDIFAAKMLPMILTRQLSQADKSLVELAFVEVVAHPISDVRMSIAAGLSIYDTKGELSSHAINFWVEESVATKDMMLAQESLPYRERKLPEHIYREVNERLRHNFYNESHSWFEGYANLDLTTVIGARNNLAILKALSTSNDQHAIEAYQRCSTTLVHWWDLARTRRGMLNRDIELENEMASLLAAYLLEYTSDTLPIVQPLLTAIDTHARELSTFLQHVLVAQLQNPRSKHFWTLWSQFITQVKQAKWISQLSSDGSVGSGLIHTLFFVTHLDNPHRRSELCEGHEPLISDLFEQLPHSAPVLDAYLYFLYHLGERALPQAFIQLSATMKQSANDLLTAPAALLLERLLTRFVYTRPSLLKQTPMLLEGVIFLLDKLVERGSAQSYRMRDDFLTPLSVS